MKINEVEWQVSEPVGHRPLWLLMDSVYRTPGPSIDNIHQQPLFQAVAGDEWEPHGNPRAF